MLLYRIQHIACGVMWPVAYGMMMCRPELLSPSTRRSWKSPVATYTA